MAWVSIKKRKPIKSEVYYWIGKSNYGGRDYFDVSENRFLFNDDVPVNKVSEDNLYWLDETDIPYEECE